MDKGYIIIKDDNIEIFINIDKINAIRFIGGNCTIYAGGVGFCPDVISKEELFNAIKKARLENQTL